uniref:SAC3_GANP domain-containing protein n=1 Tax=Rhabditophanes sp. KR3021 TaxID=114890 RepID=A0AC35U8S3_9BILA
MQKKSRVSFSNNKFAVSSGSIKKELARLNGQVCKTNEEKVILLKKRDDLIRKLLELKEKDGNLNSLKTVGLCTSFCSDLEFYERQIQNIVSRYEKDGLSNASRNLFVKEYRRPAAGDSTNLPYYIRTEDTLFGATYYLMSSVKEEETKQAYWYNFMWNRTRAIRKEIFEQELVSEKAVIMVEAISRFHIYCRYKLRKLKISEFDQKLNDQGIVECFGSLKRIYRSLGNKTVQYQLNEAEFMSYSLLLQLSNIPAILQSFSIDPDSLTRGKSLKKLPQLLKFISAYANQNYVLIFDYLKDKTTFLEMCLCHRYLHSLRKDALSIIAKAYKGTKLELNFIGEILKVDKLCDIIKLAEESGFQCIGNSMKHTAYSKESNIQIEDDWIDTKQDGDFSAVVLGKNFIVEDGYDNKKSTFTSAGTYIQDEEIEKYLNCL